MYDFLPDHTEHIQRTGYPLDHADLPVCANCGQEIGWHERVYRLECGWVCEDCFKDELEDLGLCEIALALGIECATACDVEVCSNG